MKYIKMSAIVFAATLILSVFGANAATWMGFSDVKVDSLGRSTKVSTQSKQTYGYQSAQLSSARDNLSSLQIHHGLICVVILNMISL